MTSKTQARREVEETGGFYGDQFTEEERERIARLGAAGSLADEVWMQRVVNRRLLEWLGEADPDELSVAMRVKLVKALRLGTERVAQLVRENQALAGEAEGELKAEIDRARQALAEEAGR